MTCWESNSVQTMPSSEKDPRMWIHSCKHIDHHDWSSTHGKSIYHHRWQRTIHCSATLGCNSFA